MKQLGLIDVVHRSFVLSRLCFFFFVTVFFAACTDKPKHESPANYDLARPKKIIMKEDLLEISGITFLSDSVDLVLAINDEQGKLFVFDSLKKRPDVSRFAKPADYEDVTICNTHVFVLRSDGTLFSFPVDSILSPTVSSVEWSDVLPKGEYEGIHAHNNSIYVLCKTCGKDKNHCLGYKLTLHNDSITAVNQFSIDTEEIREKYDLKFGFRPSALAWNTSTQEWFILSSVNKLLMTTDGDWKVKNVYTLSPKTFIQPEGIAFDQHQNLYVSNEGNETRNGNILKFVFRPNKKK